jgi:hypothetical protein
MVAAQQLGATAQTAVVRFLRSRKARAAPRRCVEGVAGLRLVARIELRESRRQRPLRQRKDAAFVVKPQDFIAIKGLLSSNDRPVDSAVLDRFYRYSPDNPLRCLVISIETRAPRIANEMTENPSNFQSPALKGQSTLGLQLVAQNPLMQARPNVIHVCVHA